MSKFADERERLFHYAKGVGGSDEPFMPVVTSVIYWNDAERGELRGLHKLALEGTDARCLAQEAAQIGILLALGKIHRGRAVVRLQEINDSLCSDGTES